MSIDKKVRLGNFFIRLKSWEYWPFGIVQFPVIIYFFWLSLRARSFLFFSASNPGIVMGGMFGESKYEVLKKIPDRHVPVTAFVNVPCPKEEVMRILGENNLKLPVIFKPDLGERGFMVKRISSESDVASYLSKMKHNFIAQELIDLPLEFGVFYFRLPHQSKGIVSSVVMKEMLSVTGDGASTLEALILKNDRAKLQWSTLKFVFAERWRHVIPQGEVVELVSIGNHCLGTKFLNGSHLINERLSNTFDNISKNIDGFYFGRFDLRCATLEDLYNGNVKILELNGCGAEPAHIYHPGFSLFQAIKVLLRHWKNIFLVARENVERGTPYVSFKEARMHYRRFKEATQI
jgi:hypothetical protein